MRRIDIIAIIGLLAFSIAGCTSNKKNIEDTHTETAITADDNTSSVEPIEDESKVEDFSYRSKGDGTIAIDGYNGTATRIIIPEEIDGMKVVAVSGFISNEDITYVYIPESVKSLELRAFYGCTNLKEVQLSEGLEEIGESAFGTCDSLKEIKIPDTVTTLGESAFRSSGLESFSLSSSIENIPEGAFAVCHSLKGTVVIPSTVKTLGHDSFADDTAITEVVIEDGVTTMEECVFEGCTSLTKATVPASVTNMDEGAFSDGTNITFYVEAGSAAEEYAKMWDYKYEIIQ